MKKKGLLILLVVFLVAILTFSVFACGGGGKDKGDGNKKPTTDTDDKDDGKKPAGLSGSAALNAMLSDIVKSVDDTIKVATAIDGQASITATIYADIEVDGKPYNVELNILGSMDNSAADKTWALVQANILDVVKVNIFAVDSANGETLYIGQNILNEGVKWSKLSQFKDANLLTDFVCNELFGLLTKLKTDSGAAIEKGLVSNLQILNQPLTSLLGLVSGAASSLIVPGANAGADYKTETGYSANLQLASLGDILSILPTLGVNIPANIAGIIEPIAGILLGGKVDLDGAEVFKANEGETVEIGLSVDKTADGTFGGLGLSYKSTKTSDAGESVIKVAFGLKDVEFKAVSLATSDNELAKVAYEESKGAGELAIALNLDLNLPGVSEETLKATINVFPNIKVGFVGGAVKADFSDMYAYADLVVGENTYEIAQYNVNEKYPEDLIINLEPLFAIANPQYYYSIGDLPLVYRVPVDLQAKTGNWVAPAPANAEGDASTNIIDVIYTKIAGMFGPEGFKFDIGAIMGLVGDLGTIVDAITPYLDNIVIDTETAGQASVTVNFETLMAELLAPNTGLISTIQSDWNNFSLIKYVDEVPTLVENLKLADLLKKEDVLANIVALVNSSVYDGYVKGYVPADEEDVPYSYADFYAYVADELTVDRILTTIKAFVGADIDAANLYNNLALTLAGYAQTADGIGASIAISAGADDAVKTASIGLGLKLIENKAAYTGDVIAYAGDVVCYKREDWGDVDTTKEYSNNTGNDGAALLLEAIKALVKLMDYDEEYNSGVINLYLPKRNFVVKGGEDAPYAVENNAIAFVSDGNAVFYKVEPGMLGSAVFTWTGDVVVNYYGNDLTSGASVMDQGNGIVVMISAEAGTQVNIAVEIKAAPAGTEDDPFIQNVTFSEGGISYVVAQVGSYSAIVNDTEESVTINVNPNGVIAYIGSVQVTSGQEITLAAGEKVLFSCENDPMAGGRPGGKTISWQIVVAE